LNGPTGDLVDSVIARESAGGTIAWYLPDRLGTIRDLINNSGGIIDHVDYSAFGTVLDESSPSSGDRMMGFAGMERDTVTGLNLAVNRVQNPGTGRWTSPDPLGFAAGNPDLYGYVANNPIYSADRNGEYAEPPQSPGGQTPAGQGMSAFRQGVAPPSLYLGGFAYRYVAEQLQQLYVDGGYENDLQGAVRHASWLALMTYYLGRDTAVKIAESHERGNPNDNTKTGLDTRRDRHNNRLGIAIAQCLLADPEHDKWTEKQVQNKILQLIDYLIDDDELDWYLYDPRNINPNLPFGPGPVLPKRTFKVSF
jgi:RHS repeat-associated protein